MYPNEAVFYFKNEKSRSEFRGGINSTISIYNSRTNSAVVLMDAMGNKIALATTNEDINQEKLKQSKFTVEYTDETKAIAGYKCKKAIIKLEEGTVIEVFYTNEINLSTKDLTNPYSDKIRGIFMEYVISQNGFDMKFIATKVELKKIDDNLFIAPEGYKYVTKEELKEMFMIKEE